MTLIDELIRTEWLKTPRIIEAFRKIKRADFLPQDLKDMAEVDTALPIGAGQTISQPLVVAFMMELLRPEPGEKILDIGAGSGWTSALLAYIVSQKGSSKLQIPNYKQIPNSKFQITNGKIIALEVLPELKSFGEKNVAKYSFIGKGIIKFICADGSKGYKQEAPFDKILCSAAVQKEVPAAWREQLKVGGRIVAPIKNSVWLFVKKSEQGWDQTEYPGFAFVPLVNS